jgi:ParB-like chromosome segregation protein Spo0J
VGAERRVPESLEQFAVPLAALRPYEGNPRRGDTRAIRESLERNGQYRSIVVNRRTMEVLAGNHTLRAAIELGWEEIAATFVDVDDEQARRIVLVDNRTNDLAGYDSALLAELLERAARPGGHRLRPSRGRRAARGGRAPGSGRGRAAASSSGAAHTAGCGD